MVLKVLVGLMAAFVSDFDGTLCYYQNKNNDQTSDITTLPKSSSGKVGVISGKTQRLISEISSTGTEVIIASGMRPDTMRTRISYFPSIRYWVCENGGLIFQTAADPTTGNLNVSEIVEWSSIFENDLVGREALEALAGKLRSSSDVSIDRIGYRTMIRIKKVNAEFDLGEIKKMIPKNLKYTTNLGYLDVFLQHSGKLSAIKWLLSHLSSKYEESETIQTDGSVDGEVASLFRYMGDDDNDVEIGSNAHALYVTLPCSNLLKETAHKYLKMPREGAPHVHIASSEGPTGAEENLAHALASIIEEKRLINSKRL